MGRAAGHLALGIGKAAAATLTIIPEEFRGKATLRLDELCDIIIGSIIKRKLEGKGYGIAVLAEGLIEAIGEKGLLDGAGRAGTAAATARSSATRTATCGWARSSSAG